MTTITAGLALMGVQAADGNGCVPWRLPPPARWTLDAKHRGPQVPPNTLPETLDAFMVSAWVKPAAFARFNEIFRIESGTGRVLFSFQENGKILSLGLHGTRYVECDGPIDPVKAADGQWHFAVASLNKGMMRVWFDGAERMAVPLPGGRAVVARGVPGFVGSSSGIGEFFTGEIAALTIESRATTASEVLRTFSEQCAAYGATFDEAGLRASLAARRDAVCEFRPITPEQRACVSAAERARDAAFDAFWAKLFPQGIEAATREQLIAAASADWPAVPERPVRERVAPYHPPVTPAPRQLTRAEAEVAIEADWLRQADGRFDPVDELARTEALIRRLKADASVVAPGCGAGRAVNVSAGLRAAVAQARTPEEKMSAYLAVRRVKREVMFGNPLVRAMKRLLVLDSPNPEGSEWKHETRHRLGYMGVPGGQLLALDGLRPDARVTRLAPHAPFAGSFWRPDVSYDGTSILFCFKPH
ncbi:MAG: LamG domain-containing protein, partial [Kiritimatiellae bacterium]|nr:LamG domain-containing protein [Kiritimatiellia bacterium]